MCVCTTKVGIREKKLTVGVGDSLKCGNESNKCLLMVEGIV